MRTESPEIPPTHTSPHGEIVAPARFYEVAFEETGLLILPGLWKTQTARFPQPLGRREQMRRPQAQQALLLVSLSEDLKR